MLILNLTRGKSTWMVPLRLPATPAEIGEAYSKLDLISKDESSTHIASVVSELGFLDGYLRDKHLDSFDEVNELARRIDRMNEQERRTLEGALAAESISSAADVLRIADSLKDYFFIAGVTTEKELGRLLIDSGYMDVPESIRPYLDYAAIGTEYYAERGGAFTAEGYTLRRNNAEPLLPWAEEQQMPIFRLFLRSPDWQKYNDEPCVLELPATPEQFREAREKLGVSDLADASLVRVECLIERLEPYIPLHKPDLTLLQDLAVLLSADLESGGEKLALAVFDANRPDSLAAACDLAIELDRSELLQTGLEEYGRNALYDLCADLEIEATIDGFMDWEAFGLHMMEEDGVVFTHFGCIQKAEPSPQRLILLGERIKDLSPGVAGRIKAMLGQEQRQEQTMY